MKKRILISLSALLLATAILLGSSMVVPTLYKHQSAQAATMSNDLRYSGPRASMALSASNIYLTWWDNKTGNNEVYVAASNDGGKTFGDAVMLKSVGTSPIKKLTAPPPTTISVDTIAAASGTNEYVVWWDNKTGNWDIIFARSSDGKT